MNAAQIAALRARWDFLTSEIQRLQAEKTALYDQYQQANSDIQALQAEKQELLEGIT